MPVRHRPARCLSSRLKRLNNPLWGLAVKRVGSDAHPLLFGLADHAWLFGGWSCCCSRWASMAKDGLLGVVAEVWARLRAAPALVQAGTCMPVMVVNYRII